MIIVQNLYCSLCDYDLCHDCFGVKPNPNSNFKDIIKNPIISNIQNLFNSEFQIKSFKILNENYKNENLIYSPLSIQITLGLISNFLNGKSLSEFKNILLFQDLSFQNNLFIKILKILSNISSLNIINPIFCPIEYSSNYNNLISEFNSIISKNKEDLNKFIKEKTNNKINSFFNDSFLFGMILVNILYFKVPWKKKFEENVFQARFYGNDNSEKPVKMMHLTDDFNYYKDKSIEMIEIPYNVEGLFALILLPYKELNLDNLINELDQEKMDLLINKLTIKKIDLTIPKFTLLEKKKINLVKMLKKIGINSIFDSLSDFSQLFSNFNDININEFYQTNLIEIDEKGNENSSFYSIDNPLIYSKNMTVNRPLLFIIRSNKIEKGKDIILINKVEEI